MRLSPSRPSLRRQTAQAPSLMQSLTMSRDPAWKRSWDEALADGQERERMSKSNAASLEDNSDEELIIKKTSQTRDIFGAW